MIPRRTRDRKSPQEVTRGHSPALPPATSRSLDTSGNLKGSSGVWITSLPLQATYGIVRCPGPAAENFFRFFRFFWG